MGYDVTVKFKTEQDREKMKNFILANSDLLQEMVKVDSYGPVHDSTPYNGEDLGYAPDKKNLLGFHGTGIPKYIWDLCAWMSVKAECKDRKGNHFFYYDSEKMIVTFDTNDTKNTLVDENGINIKRDYKNSSFPEKFIAYLLSKEKLEEKQRKLFVQLNERWKEYDLQNTVEPVKPKRNKP
jgi:hypothetical protein